MEDPFAENNRIAVFLMESCGRTITPAAPWCGSRSHAEIYRCHTCKLLKLQVKILAIEKPTTDYTVTWHGYFPFL
jgi:hypothetical protein